MCCGVFFFFNLQPLLFVFMLYHPFISSSFLVWDTSSVLSYVG